jgi:RNA polymerase sigma-70 factor (ECF subfamily)
MLTIASAPDRPAGRTDVAPTNGTPPIGATSRSAAPDARPPATDEASLLRAIRRGDETAFLQLVERHYPATVRLARVFLPDEAEATADVAWRQLLGLLDHFDGRVSLRAWLARLVVRCAVERGAAHPLPRLPGGDDVRQGSAAPPAVAPQSPFAAGPDGGRWLSPPQRSPASGVPGATATRPVDEAPPSLRRCARRAIDSLPLGQRAVLTLRDVEGWPAEEVDFALDIPPAAQVGLLHLARTAVHRALVRCEDDRSRRGR